MSPDHPHVPIAPLTTGSDATDRAERTGYMSDCTNTPQDGVEPSWAADREMLRDAIRGDIVHFRIKGDTRPKEFLESKLRLALTWLPDA